MRKVCWVTAVGLIQPGESPGVRRCGRWYSGGSGGGGGGGGGSQHPNIFNVTNN